MADKKISALTDGSTPATTDLFPAARSGGTTVQMAWSELHAAMPSYEVGYDQITSSVTVTSTTEATGTTVISCSAHVFDGSPVIAEFFAPSVQWGVSTNTTVTLALFESGTEIGQLAVAVSSSGTTIQAPFSGKLRFTPSAGSHTYTVTGFKAPAGATAFIVACGAGGTATLVPAYVRFTKV